MTIYVGPRISGATGGTISNISGYTIHTFSSGAATFTPQGSGALEVLVVGAGGGGGNGTSWGAGGGGGGAVIYARNIPVIGGVSFP